MQISTIALITLSILLFEHCTTVTLTRYTQQRTDVPRASPTVVVLLTEMLKMVMSVWLELTHTFGLGSQSSLQRMSHQVVGSWGDTIRVSVPAFLYTIQNISIFIALGNLEVVSFQVLYQTKLMLTAILSVLFLGRRLGRRQWLALFTLTVGVVAVELSDDNITKKSSGRRLSPTGELCSGDSAPTWSSMMSLQVSPLDAPWSPRDVIDTPCGKAPLDSRRLAETAGRHATVGSHGKAHPHGALSHAAKSRDRAQSSTAHGQQQPMPQGAATAPHANDTAAGRQPLVGVLAALLAALLSSFAGVYFEGLVKGNEVSPPSLWVRNVQLCVFTIPLAAIAVVSQRSTVFARGVLTGIDAPTSILITLNASGGLLVAAVIKYGDNILKNFTTACSVILGTIISVYLFDFQLSAQFAWGSALVVGSAYAYATTPSPATEPSREADDEDDQYEPVKDESDTSA